ncbi:hypothetical protein RYX36_027279, partial [Vicia faba]
MAKFCLGIPGPWANDYREPSDPFTTKIGGFPDWPIPIDAINSDLLQCSTCANNISLVAQICAPLSHHQHRVLFIFGCVSPKCATTSCRVLRLQKIETPDIDTSQHKQPTEVQILNLEDEDETTSCRVLRLQKIETPNIDTSQHKQPTEVQIINLEDEDE